jgi:hypothetical protein
MRLRIVAPALAVVGMLAVLPAHAVDVTSCGQVVPAGEVGNLVADLDCAGTPVAVVLARNAGLEMGGFRLSGGFPGGNGVACEAGACLVNGPGRISGFDFGVTTMSGSARRLSVSGVDFDGNSWGIRHEGRGLTSVTDVTIRDCLNGAGVLVWRLRATNVRVERCINGFSVVTSVKGENVAATDNGNAGIAAGGQAALRGVTARGNQIGINARLMRLTDSDSTGNPFADLLSGGRPRLTNTTCGTSRNYNTGDTFGICQDD